VLISRLRANIQVHTCGTGFSHSTIDMLRGGAKCKTECFAHACVTVFTWKPFVMPVKEQSNLLILILRAVEVGYLQESSGWEKVGWIWQVQWICMSM